MPVNITLLVSSDTLHELYEACETRKSEVKIDRNILNQLVIDYSVLYQAVQGSSQFKLTEPTKRQRIKLKD